MSAKRTVGAKGQVVIPKDMRDQLGISPGSEIVFDLRDDKITIRPGRDPASEVEAYLSVIKDKLKKEVDLKKIIEEESFVANDLPGQ